MKIKRIFAAIAAALLVASLNGTAIAATPKASGPDAAPKTDNLKNPKAEKQAALRQQAQEMVLKGQATPKGDNRVVKVAKGQYVELARQGEDDILTLLGGRLIRSDVHPAIHLTGIRRQHVSIKVLGHRYCNSTLPDGRRSKKRD